MEELTIDDLKATEAPPPLVDDLGHPLPRRKRKMPPALYVALAVVEILFELFTKTIVATMLILFGMTLHAALSGFVINGLIIEFTEFGIFDEPTYSLIQRFLPLILLYAFTFAILLTFFDIFRAWLEDGIAPWKWLQLKKLPPKMQEA